MTQQDLKSLYKNLPGIQFTIDFKPNNQFRFLAVSNEFLEASGYGEKQVIGRTIEEVLPESARLVFIDMAHKAIRERKSLRWNEKALFPAGEKYSELTLKPIFNKKGDCTSFNVFVNDITSPLKEHIAIEEKETETRLKKLTKAVEFAPLSIVITDKNGTIEYTNPYFSKLTGFEKSEVIGENPRILQSGKTSKELYSEMWNTILSGKSWEGEFINRSKDGEEYIEQANIAPVFDSENNISHFVAIKQNITERKRKEEELQDFNDRFQLLSKSGGEFIWQVDMKGRITYSSSSLKKLYGYNVENASQFNIKDLFSEPDKDRAMGALTNAMAGMEYQLIQLDGVRQDGSTVPLEISVTPVLRNGTVVGAIGLTRDISSLKQAEVESRTIIKTAMDGFGMNDMQGNFLEVNDAYCHMTGYSREELLQMSIRDLEATELPEETTERISNVIKNGFDRFETKHFTKEGGILDVEVSVNYISFSGGRLYSFFRDITERKKVEAALRGSEEKYRIITDYNNDGITIADELGNYVFVNPSFCRMSGYTEKELLSMKVFDMKDRNTPQNSFEQKRKIESFQSGDNILKRKDQSSFVADIRGRKINFRDNEYFLGIIRDVTEQRKIEFALKESEDKFRQLVESSSDWIWEVDKNGKYTYVSPQVEDLLGYKPKEVLGKTPFDFMPEEEAARVGDIFLNFINKKIPFRNLENINLDKNNNIVILETSGVPIFDEKGGLQGYRGVDREITERKNAEKKIMEQNKELKDLNETRDKFFSIMTHDLKSPFNTILGFSDLLIKDLDNKNYDKLDEYARYIYNSSEHSVKLLMNLVEWSHSQSGIIKFNPEIISLELIINETILLLENSARKKSLKISIREPVDYRFLADKNMLKTVLRNIVSNAIKYTYPNENILIYAEENKAEIMVSIEDNGVGIEENRITRIFELGDNNSTYGTDNETGTGLGLILCKEFIDKHGGKIWAESKKGKGTIFRFVIPKNKQVKS